MAEAKQRRLAVIPEFNPNSCVAGIMKQYAWFEVWVDDTARPPYVLILMSNLEESSFDIYDPGEKVVRHSVNSYQDAMFWLTEDEYTKVDGRMALE